MSGEKLKRTLKHPPKPPSFGIPRNIAVGPLRFKAELNPSERRHHRRHDREAEQSNPDVNPGSSPNENQDEVQQPFKSKASTVVGIGRGNPFASKHPRSHRYISFERTLVCSLVQERILATRGGNLRGTN